MTALELPTEDFRRLATHIVDLCAGYLCTLDKRSTFPRTTGAESERIFDLDLPERGMGDQAFAALTDVIATSRAQNGRFFAYVQGSGEPIAALGDLLGSILNQSITAWRSSPAGVTIERTVVRWLSEAVGCRGFVGTLTSGGRPPTSWSWPWHARRKLQPMSTVFTTHGLITSLSDNHVQQLTDRTAPTVCLSLQTAVNRPNQ